MASPAVAASGAGGVTTAADPWNFNSGLGTASANDLVIFLFRFAAAATVAGVTVGAGKSLTVFASSTADASDDSTFGYYRYCDGSENLATAVIDASTSVKGAWIAYRITGAEDPATQAPEEFEAVGTGSNPDPPNATPTGGSKDYLWVAFCGADGEQADASVPTNYSTGGQAANSGTGGAVATNCRIGGGTRQTTAPSENPGTFTLGAAANGWTAWTIAVHPAGAGGTTYTKAGFGRENA